MFIRSLSLFAFGLSSLAAEPLKVSPGLFQTPEFKQRFVGSYDFSELTAYMLAKGFHITAVIQFGRSGRCHSRQAVRQGRGPS